MSKLQVNSIAKLDGTLEVLTDYVSGGSAKVLCHANGTGTIAVNASLNIASITDNGTGDIRFNFTTSFANTSGQYISGSVNFDHTTVTSRVLCPIGTLAVNSSRCNEVLTTSATLQDMLSVYFKADGVLA